MPTVGPVSLSRLLCVVGSLALRAVAQSNAAVVQAHVAAHANETFREASGYLHYPYLVPSGPYTQAWDWDSMFMGAALRGYGATPYFVGTFKNFLAQVNLTNGDLPGCVTPDGPTQTLYHAKPMIIQAAWLASKQTSDPAEFAPFAPAMRALLRYWNSSQRVDTATGLHQWHDQLETGCDNLVYSECPSSFSPECWSESQAFTLSSPDVEVWLVREWQAYAKFVAAWRAAGIQAVDTASGPPFSRLLFVPPGASLSNAWRAEEAGALATAASLRDALNSHLWFWEDEARGRGFYVGFNTSTHTQIRARTFQVAWPVWAGLATNESVATAALASLLEPDLRCAGGLRSVSSQDPRYNNDNIIDPYSNWRGPIWVNVNAIMAYTLARHGLKSEALALADDVVRTLADDLRATQTWHECYSAQNQSGLAAPGFLSWDTLGATLQADVAADLDPLDL